MMWDNNPDWYTHKALPYEPKWEKYVNYSPDANPSASAIFTTCIGTRIFRVFQVRGLGVIVMTAGNGLEGDGMLIFDGMSVLTKEEIGFAPEL